MSALDELIRIEDLPLDHRYVIVAAQDYPTNQKMFEGSPAGPIVWETYLNGSTLEAVTKKAESIAAIYGGARIARLMFIDEDAAAYICRLERQLVEQGERHKQSRKTTGKQRRELVKRQEKYGKRIIDLETTVSKLPKYEDTGEHFVPGVDPCWMSDRGLTENRGPDASGFDCRDGTWFYGNAITRFFSTNAAALNSRADAKAEGRQS